jgi:D-alanyl-lipoteichoic acid acyltransferase DltB (MBOAT superfamily)
METVQQNSLSLSQYIVYRNGVPAGARGSMRNMFERSFGAPTFAGFWRHWNPIFSYGLGRYIYSPLKRLMPSALAVVSTFIFCGMLHDLVTMAVRGAPAFLFTPWFFLLGTGVVLGRALSLDLSDQPWLVKATVNLTYLAVCLAITLGIKYLVP